jgi:hypothetical protein
MEDVGAAVVDGDGDGDVEDRYPPRRYAYSIWCLFSALHDAGVAHGDVEMRHVRRGYGLARDPHAVADAPRLADLGLRLIDLARASTSAAAIERERDYLRRLLRISAD